MAYECAVMELGHARLPSDGLFVTEFIVAALSNPTSVSPDMEELVLDTLANREIGRKAAAADEALHLRCYQLQCIVLRDAAHIMVAELMLPNFI